MTIWFCVLKFFLFLLAGSFTNSRLAPSRNHWVNEALNLAAIGKNYAKTLHLAA